MIKNFCRRIAKLFNLIPEQKKTEDPVRQSLGGKHQRYHQGNFTPPTRKKKNKKGKNGEKLNKVKRRKC